MSESPVRSSGRPVVRSSDAAADPWRGLLSRLLARDAAIAVTGLGYVGLPLAVCLAKRFLVIGYDRDPARIAELVAGRDPVGEVGDAAVVGSGIRFTADPADLAAADVHILCVPTPVDAARRPDLSPLIDACATVGARLRPGTCVVVESTVYPGCTAEDCAPALARASGLVCGRDFTVGYSPERINPGDREHTVDRVPKVVAGMDAATLDLVAGIYGAAIPAGVHRAPSLAVAEAAKALENTQRDLNIALMNEVALICHRLGIDTRDVLAAAGTKWNFLRFEPGLVGGHCIGVDPYYLTHRAQAAGHHAEVILAGRRINDGMGAWIAQECVRLLAAAGRPVAGARVLVLGITFKEDVADVRNSRAADIVHELRRFGCAPLVADPVADPAAVRHEHGLDLAPWQPLPACDAAILAVRHAAFRDLAPAALAAAAGRGAPVLDVKGILDRAACAAAGLVLWRL